MCLFLPALSLFECIHFFLMFMFFLQFSLHTIQFLLIFMSGVEFLAPFFSRWLLALLLQPYEFFIFTKITWKIAFKWAKKNDVEWKKKGIANKRIDGEKENRERDREWKKSNRKKIDDEVLVFRQESKWNKAAKW